MPTPPTDIANLYNILGAGELSRLDTHPVELLVTLRTISEALPLAPQRIADVGGGPGKYAFALADQGHLVHLVDLTESPPPPTPPTPPTLLPNALRLGGPSDNHFADRKRDFGTSRLPQCKQKSFLRLMWIAFNDKLMILLTISATISLAVGIYQAVGPNTDSSGIEWVDGVTIFVAITVIVIASAATDWQNNYKFKKLNGRRDQRNVTVIRSGRFQIISRT